MIGKRAFRRFVETQQNILNGDDEKFVYEYIEECINKQEPLNKVLRLLCLLSQVGNGIPAKKLRFFKKEIIQVRISSSK